MRAIIVFSIYSIWSNHVRENDSDWVELVLKMSDLVWRKNYAFLQKSKSIRDCGLKIYWGRLKISLEIGCFWIFDVVVLSMFSFWNWKKKRNVFRSFAWDFVGRALKSFFVEKRSPLCTFDRIFETVAAITFDYSLYEEKDTGLLTSISFCSDDFEPYTRLYYKCALHFRSAVAKGRFRLGIIKMLLREWFFSNATRASKLLLLLVLHSYVL